MSHLREPTAREQRVITALARACIRLEGRERRVIQRDIREIAARIIALADALESGNDPR